jgi:hypothetical protein
VKTVFKKSGYFVPVLAAVVLLILSLMPINSVAQPLKILHLGFHKGCLNDIEEVAQELGADITSWYILASERPREHFDGVTRGNGVYNITHERAQRVWEKHKNYFNQFDVIMTSDTAPLARIFLQNNNWKKPLIIWICNRFNYADYETLDGRFPDQEFYDLFRNAAHNNKVKIISYTPYEHHYARYFGVEIGTRMIRPIGVTDKLLQKKNAQNSEQKEFKSAIPANIKKEDTVFLYPRLGESEVRFAQEQCAHAGVPLYHGAYNGPADLQDFKGVLYFPYQISNLALFENIQRGIIHFIPSINFIINAINNGLPVRNCTGYGYDFCEWYSQDFADCFVYFDSWQDLKHKIASTDYQAMSAKIKAKARQHRAQMLQEWAQVFSECEHTLVSR